MSFVAGAGITDISFAGYQSPARLWAEDISLTTGGGGNLLGLTWTFTPFNPLDTTDAGQFNDGYGTGTNGLHLENGTGDLDRFDQIVNTVPGQMYTLDFLFINTANPNNAPSELLVSATAVPEPSSLALMLTLVVGFACGRLVKARTIGLR